VGQTLRIVLDGLRGESSVAELCRKEGINPNLYYRWSKDFLEAGKKRLSGDTVREANTDEVVDLKCERIIGGTGTSQAPPAIRQRPLLHQW